MVKILVLLMFGILLANATAAQNHFETDHLSTSASDLTITCIGHGTLMFTFQDYSIHVDPYGMLADYATLPNADLIFITHDHGDHLDPDAIDQIRTEDTIVILPEVCADRVEGGLIMHNGDVQTVLGIKIEAVPAYNIVHKRDNGQPYHPKGVGNGYIFTFGDRRVYVAGDTENIPEMNALQGIDVAFLPMNLPYTMTPEMVADAARTFTPDILYPYHYGETDASKLVDALKDAENIEVRIRNMQ
ncbi:MBL fold metallo-hydrolase [candidate division KSB3 bacterium]|uniref:MBL fold metallo-hydrolase n=1 Tax=candidate division KSB3 bacterium TaxID=2044937 RepID=A0A9D5JVH0_9BACT|nr:MBL fold metallo-hydrolase [candidate division KSB3 bacterium]MBD3324905.1 MBL fold metallo-hydrolase [candidate division KSB3 bacterium]